MGMIQNKVFTHPGSEYYIVLNENEAKRLGCALAATGWEEKAPELYRPIDIHGEEPSNDHGC